MKNKNTRYIKRIIVFDNNRTNINIVNWDEKYFDIFIKEQEKHYGLKILSNNYEINVIIEYTNIMWDYKIYYASYKQRYHSILDEEKWKNIEKDINDDLKIMGIEELKKQILNSIKNKKYFEYKDKINKQFKKYCISEK